MSTETNPQNLGEALTLIRIKKSEIARAYELRSQEFSDSENEIEVKKKFQSNSEAINLKLEELRKLKTRIEKTNHETIIDTPDGKMTVSEAILLIGNYRSLLSDLQELRSKYKVSDYSLSDKKVKYYFGLNPQELEKEIAVLEMKKARLDSFLQVWNWKTQLK